MNTTIPRWVDIGLMPLVNVAVAFLVAGLVVLFIGENPLTAAYLIVNGAFGSGYNLGFTLFYATTFIFTGLAVAVAFHASLFNIGGEGQAYIGGLGVGLVALSLDAYLPWWLTFPIAILGAAAFGALWATGCITPPEAGAPPDASAASQPGRRKWNVSIADGSITWEALAFVTSDS